MKIALATDAWHPQISGVVTTLTQTIEHLRRMGHEVFTIHPGFFSTVPCPTYPQIRLAINPRARLSRLMDRFQPDAIHIATEGPQAFPQLYDLFHDPLRRIYRNAVFHSGPVCFQTPEVVPCGIFEGHDGLNTTETGIGAQGRHSHRYLVARCRYGSLAH